MGTDKVGGMHPVVDGGYSSPLYRARTACEDVDIDDRQATWILTRVMNPVLPRLFLFFLQLQLGATNCTIQCGK